MKWTVEPDIDRFDEAVDWFLKRVVMTAEDALELDADARQRAFWIGGGLQLTQIQRVFDKITTAIEKGETFDEWRKKTLGELRNDAHAETVFRNAVQRAYNAGRWKQMHHPETARFRPFLMYDSILDSRTTETCHALNGTILPIDHEFWRTHVPPRHHRCRASLRNLRESEARRRGITSPAPAVDTEPGWGLAPELDPVWKPDPRKHDPALMRELEQKSEEPKQPEKPKPKPEHDPAHWESLYRKGEGKHADDYGDAAPAIAWGRAMLERGLDRPVRELVEELERLMGLAPTELKIKYQDAVAGLRRFPQDEPLRARVSGKFFAGVAAMLEHTRTIQPGPMHGVTLPSGSAGEAVRSFYETFLDKSVTRPTGYRVLTWDQIPENERPFASPRAFHWEVYDLIGLVPGNRNAVAVHEFAHAIERRHPKALARSKAFLHARTRDTSKPKNLRVPLGDPYEPWEESRPDEFRDAYMGHATGKQDIQDQHGTEITSMGYEELYGGPGLWNSYLFGSRQDPDMFFFLLGQLAGK